MANASKLVETITTLATKVADGGVTVGTTYDIEETETRTFPRPDALTVEGVNGTITLQRRGDAEDVPQRSDTEEIHVEVTKRAKDEADLDSLRLDASGGEEAPLALAVVHEDDADGAVDLVVTLPEGVAVERAEMKNGGIEAEGVQIAHATTKNGGVTIRDGVGDTTLRTTNGKISVDGLDGYVDAETTNGAITVRGATGVDRTEATNGGIDVDVNEIRQDTVIESRTGRVEVHPGPDLDADVSLRTNMGSIESSVFEKNAAGLGTLRTGGVVGDGGHDLRIETRVGKIEFGR
jgi:DUF4097 and DUF4098 domain-containing protein YvlB